MFSKHTILLICWSIFFSVEGYSQNNNIFYGGNSSGGKIYCYSQADAVLNNNIFIGGNASGNDMLCYAQADAVLNNNIFTGGNSSGDIVSCVGTSEEIPLPINLLFFTAQPETSKVKLTWGTASELNNNYFTVYRSKDALNWQEVNRTTGAGNSSMVLHYQEYDYEPYLGISYYRLRQTDFDGKFSHSPIVPVDLLNKKDTVFIHPNPAKDKIYISTISSKDFNVKIINMYGYVLYHLMSPSEINIQEFCNGVYIVQTTFIREKTTSTLLIVNK